MAIIIVTKFCSWGSTLCWVQNINVMYFHIFHTLSFSEISQVLAQLRRRVHDHASGCLYPPSLRPFEPPTIWYRQAVGKVNEKGKEENKQTAFARKWETSARTFQPTERAPRINHPCFIRNLLFTFLILYTVKGFFFSLTPSRAPPELYSAVSLSRNTFPEQFIVKL